jgi:hypothetical protein
MVRLIGSRVGPVTAIRQEIPGFFETPQELAGAPVVAERLGQREDAARLLEMGADLGLEGERLARVFAVAIGVAVAQRRAAPVFRAPPGGVKKFQFNLCGRISPKALIRLRIRSRQQRDLAAPVADAPATSLCNRKDIPCRHCNYIPQPVFWNKT